MTNQETKGPRNAAKYEAENLASHLHVRVAKSEKAAWVHAAGGLKLGEWVRRTLNEAAGFQA